VSYLYTFVQCTQIYVCMFLCTEMWVYMSLCIGYRGHRRLSTVYGNAYIYVSLCVRVCVCIYNYIYIGSFERATYIRWYCVHMYICYLNTSVLRTYTYLFACLRIEILGV